MIARWLGIPLVVCLVAVAAAPRATAVPEPVSLALLGGGLLGFGILLRRRNRV